MWQSSIFKIPFKKSTQFHQNEGMHGQEPLTRRVHIGAGVLGGLLIEQHKKKYPEATIIAETRTTSKHADLRSKVIVCAHVYLHKTPFQG